jgi:predicted nucleic-acid-binding protein
MRALDTNVLARLLLRDDAAQYKRARALLASDQQFTAPVTVLLELVWVLESNDCTPAAIRQGVGLLLNLPNFTLPQADIVSAALDAYGEGLDFADALHLGLSGGVQAFLTFDKALVKKASKTAQSVPVQPA